MQPQNQSSMQDLWDSSMFDGGNTVYLEYLYEQYLQDVSLVPDNWRNFFDNLPKTQNSQDISHAAIVDEFKNYARTKTYAPLGQAVSADLGTIEHERKQIQVTRLINAYRLQGHLHAQIDPLGMRQVADDNQSELTLQGHGLTKGDLDTIFDVDTFVGPKQMKLKDLYQALNDTYCGAIGTEFMHIPNPKEREWIQRKMESLRGVPNFSVDQKKHILERITAAEGLEKYLGVKYPGAKRFSLEGGDSLIPMIDEIINHSGENGVRDIVIGMAHRGRLNVLVNILGKKPSDLFDEFEGRKHCDTESGDVKYHQGFSSDAKTKGGNVHLALAFNPSHLEIVTPVVAGSVRCRQARVDDRNKNNVIPIAVHGDAAFAGQGVVMETLNMSQTRGYGIGGTIHIVINNQVGFTTANPRDARSTLYCTDVAKVVLAPIFHVNADSPESVVLAAKLATEYRLEFNKDVVIDLVCYRRHGHNEADDPFATQPRMYGKIKKHPTVRKIYAENLVKESIVSAQDTNDLVKQNRQDLTEGKSVAHNIVENSGSANTVDWSKHFVKDWREKANTKISSDNIIKLSDKILAVPDNFEVHNRVNKIYQDRAKMAQGDLPADWGFAENLAYASILNEGYSIRISGQDCGRGTFFHRHAVLHEQTSGENYIPLKTVNQQVKFEIIDSLLSEEAVMAFEYGYATTDPNTLVIWEAQFGDFANGAQVVIDQFISSGQQKWGRLCGLVLLLPHGYEGQGPEHSSARLERYLQLCAQHNLQVCVPSNAKQVFHMLRRQILRNIRLPLIVMSPKSLLRLKEASSPLEDFTNGEFELIIDEVEKINAKKVTKLVLCSGKVYYDLYNKRNEDNKNHIAIARIEQLYPFPEQELLELLAKYPNAKKIVWCQEEPKNQGAWFPQRHHIKKCLTNGQTLTYAGREASASPAVGFLAKHNEQQQALVEQALK